MCVSERDCVKVSECGGEEKVKGGGGEFGKVRRKRWLRTNDGNFPR